MNHANPLSDAAIADSYAKIIWWSSPLFLLSGVLYDAYLDPHPAVPIARYAVSFGNLALASAITMSWIKARNAIKAAHFLCFAYMGMIGLGYWDANASPLLLSGAFLSVLVLGSLLHSEKVIAPLYLWSGVLLGLGLAFSSQPMSDKIMMGFSIIVFVVMLSALTVNALRTRTQLHQSEQTMEAVFENSSDGLVYFHTQSGEVLRTNMQAQKLFETTEHSAIGELARTSFLNAQSEENREHAIRDAIRDRTLEATVQVSTAGNNFFWAKLSLRRIKVANNDITLLRITDVTAALLENRALQQTQRMLNRSQQLARLGSWEFETENGIWSYSDVAMDILEFAEKPTAKDIFEKFTSPQQQEVMRNAFANAVNHGKGFDLVADLTTRTGNQRSLRIIAEAIVEEGRIARVSGVFDDVSIQREREQALQEARDAAEAAARSRSQFLANMSHEIRTPMNGVIGMASLLTDTALDQQQRAYVETIRTSGESLLQILNEILDFSKIDADQVVLEERIFELERCVFDAINLLAPIAADKKLEILCKMDTASRGYFYGDTLRLRQVIVNLLSNALKFTERGEILVEVNHTATSAGDSRLTFSVTDTGAGVPPERIPALFEPFTQADSSTTRKYGGTGLGLSICRSLVELMGGKIELKSSSTEGTTFEFHIAARCADLPTDLPVFDHKLRVLAVDDNETNRVILEAMLASIKLDATVLEHPQQALEHFKEQGADLVISDMQMPDIDGVELILEMQAAHTQQGDTARGEFPKTVLLSSLDATPRTHNLFDAVLTKPARPSELQATLVSLLLENSTSNKIQEKSPQTLPPLVNDNLSILLAEDNAVNQAVAVGILNNLGFNADLAVNGKEAINMLRDNHYDIVFMDVQMPVLDGLEATRLIRANHAQSPTSGQPYIIAMTANAMREDRAACIAAGMDDFVAKPIRIRDVHACLAIALEALDKAYPPSSNQVSRQLRD